MKKFISLALCLVMLVSVFSVCGVVAGAANAGDMMYVGKTDFENDQVTYTIYLKKNVSIWGGVVIRVGFDSSALQVVDCGAATRVDQYGDETQIVPGMYVDGLLDGTDNIYTIGYLNGDLNSSYSTGSADKAFMKITFKAIDPERPVTEVDFYCVEFSSANEEMNITKNEENPQLFYKSQVSTLNKLTFSSVYSVENGLRVNWNPVTGADTYIVFKKIDGAFKEIARVPATQNFYDDTTAVANEVSTYTVRPMNEDGYCVVNSTISGIYIKAPDRVAVSIQPDSVKLGWTKVEGATGYNLYRRVINADGTVSDWTLLYKASATATTYFDESVVSGTNYEYTVRSLNNNAASAVCRYATMYYFEAPTVKVVSAVGGVSITWNDISGAETYRIYRKYNGEKSWTYIATVDAGTLSYMDKDAVTGRNIDYAVRAFAAGGSSTFVAKRCAYVATPILSSVSNAVGGVLVKWNPVERATGYRVYRRGAGSTHWTYLGTVTSTSYLDKTATSGNYWRYTVITVFYKVYSGFDTNGLYLKYMATPKLTKISNTTAGVNIKWNAVSGASGYRVYRRGAGQTTWTYLGTVTSTSYTDKNVVNNNYYRYTVRAASGSYFSGFDTNGLVIKYVKK